MIFNNKYQKIKRINKGINGIVFKVIDNTENKYYALKIIYDIENYEKEIEVMKNIKSKYIIKLKDYFYEEKEGYCIVMELCDGDLRQLLNKYKPKGLPLNIINKIFYQLNDALKVMINKGFTHRDLKPENILIKYTDTSKTNFDIKLSDFGLATNEINSSIHTFSVAGTINYMAPEVETRHYNDKCDLWSLGVILYELCTNKYIFYSDDPKKLNNNRYEGKIVKETDNEMINKLLRKLIQIDINKRIRWEEYFKDDFFKVFINENAQIINLKIEVNKDNEYIKIYNGNEDINEENIQLFIENKEMKFKKEINHLNKDNYNIIIKINQIISNCKEIFKDCKNIKDINFTKFDTTNVNNMSGMFYNCENLNNLDVNNFNTENVTDMSYMFSNCKSLNNLNITNFNTKNVTNMSGMFSFCKSLNNLNVTNFNTKNVINMSNMFSNCYSLNNLNVSYFNTEKVTDMSYMFYYCKSLNNLKISNFNTENVTNMSEMFVGCKFNDINNIFNNNGNNEPNNIQFEIPSNPEPKKQEIFSDEENKKIDEVINFMNCSREKSIEVLKMTNWNIEEACNKILDN